MSADARSASVIRVAAASSRLAGKLPRLADLPFNLHYRARTILLVAAAESPAGRFQ